MQLPLVAKVLREASALMRISSNNNNYTYARDAKTIIYNRVFR